MPTNANLVLLLMYILNKCVLIERTMITQYKMVELMGIHCSITLWQSWNICNLICSFWWENRGLVLYCMLSLLKNEICQLFHIYCRYIMSERRWNLANSEISSVQICHLHGVCHHLLGDWLRTTKTLHDTKNIV